MVQGLLLSCFTVLPGNFANAQNSKMLQQDDRYLELDVSPDFSAGMRDNVNEWTNFLSQSLLQVYGRWPRQHWRMTVAPASASADDPIPWAQVHRGDLDTIEFFVSPQASADQLILAWTGYHELAHLLIPYRGWGDNWFSEGVATYYQNILQARAGVLSEREMWQNIYEGLLRGAADDAYAAQPLKEVSEALRTEGGFMRVYWSGARYFLEADVRLRRQSGGALSLDTALEKLNRCCANQTMSGDQIAGKLDELSQTLIFRPLYYHTRESFELRPFDKLFASLGITVNKGLIILQPIGPGAQLRRQIAKMPAL